MSTSRWSWAKPFDRLALNRRRKARRRQLRTRSLACEALEKRQLLSITPYGDEQCLNTFTAGSQALAVSGNPMAAGSDGGYLVAWSSDAQDGDGWGVYGQRYDALKTVLGDEFRVSTTLDNRPHRHYGELCVAAANGGERCAGLFSG